MPRGVVKMELDWYKIEPYTESKAKNAPDKDGVYALCTLQADRTYKVRYVGQGNIRERLVDHLSAYENNLELKSHVAKYKMKASYAVVGKQSDRDGIELFLYKKFSPKFNKNTPPAQTAIEVNLFSLKYDEEK